MYPNVTLQIKNNIASLVYFHKENEPKKITLLEEDLKKVIVDLAKQLGLVKSDSAETMQELLTIARESDESYIMNYPEIDMVEVEFGLSKAVENFIKENPIQEPYQDVKMTEDIKMELEKNVRADTFACALDYLYMTMVAKALVAGAELGLGIIRLDDESKNTRLQERMAMELERMGVEFIVE